mgnify:FL=1
MLLAAATTEVVLGALVALPLIIYRFKAKRWNRIALDYPQESHETELMILLPIWNESLVIEKKLGDLNRDYPFKTSLLVIDSASSDDSVEKVKQWLSNNSSAFSNSQVIEMPERLGKTSAVKHALETLDQQSFTGLVLMTDADALISEGTIIRLHGWFSDSSIGAVGSKANRQTKLHGEKDYRSLYEILRIAESKRDSTPFLEGSCMMWRHGSLNPSDLNTDSNADDAQIASLIRIGGLRSILDEGASFIDFAPTTVEGQSRQKIRRAQGLQNMLDRFPKQHKLPETGYFSSIFRTQRYLHLIIPIMLFQIAIVAIIRWTYVSVTSMPTGYEAVLHASLAFVELLILVAWLTFRNGIRLPLVTTIGALATNFEYLFIARYRSSKGQSSHKWDQHSDVRELLDKF